MSLSPRMDSSSRPAPQPSAQLAGHAAPAGPTATYLAGAPAAFLAQADVLFQAAGGAELPAHSQFLARSCLLFSEMLDPEGEVQGRPSAAAPLRVALPRHSAADVARALQAVYHPNLVGHLAAQLQGPAEYGAQLDLAAFLRFGQLLDALRAPLTSRSARMGELVRFEFPAWLEVAERHDLQGLKIYCLECLMHLLVAPGCTARPDEPPIEQLSLELLSKPDLLLLLDGLASAVRRCAHSSYDVRTRVPCTAATLRGAGPLAAGTMPAVSWGGLLPPSPAAPATPGAAPVPTPAVTLNTSGVKAAGVTAVPAATSPQGSHLATITVPKLRQVDITGSLPGEAAISGWRRMGDLCRAADS